MSNRFEAKRGGFLEMAISARKKAKTFLDDVDQVVDWRPIERFLKKKLRRHSDAVGNPAYPPLAMFKVLLLQRWYGLSDQGMDDSLADRISFCRFAGFSFDYDTPDASTICRSATTSWRGDWTKSFSTFWLRSSRPGEWSSSMGPSSMPA